MKTNNKKLSDFLIGLRAMFAQLKPSKLNNKTKALIAAGLLAGASACHDEPQPEPTKNMTLTWDIEEGWDNIHMDTIKKYADQPDVKTVDLHLKDCYYKTSSLTPDVFHSVCDSVEKRFKYSDKVKGSGTIFVSRQGGANYLI